jgi:hypothetical protein
MDISAIKSAIDNFSRPHSLATLEPLRDTLKEGYKKGMSLKQLCEVVKNHSSLKPSPSSLGDWLKIPKKTRKEKPEEKKEVVNSSNDFAPESSQPPLLYNNVF